VLDLFSGIGGFSLGLERAGMRTVAFCEIDPFCRTVLAKHWPDVPIYEDVHTIPHVGNVDVICGGFPCQPFSSASRGRKRGSADDRYLWPAMLAVVERERPTWVIGENVTQLDGMALAQVVSDLEGIGYTVAPPLEIPACAVGYDHHRPRLWILGHSNCDGKPGCAVHAEMARLSECDCDPGGVGRKNGLPSRMDRLRAIGNAVVPDIPERIGRAIMAIK
jgi:DNA (cytosine-5)-methyltransferase 1